MFPPPGATVTCMLVAEDLLLLLTEDASGKFAVDRTGMDLALAGACVLELAEQGRVGVAASGEDVRRGRLVVRDPTPTGNAVLDLALQRCVERSGKKPQDVLPKIAKGLRAGLLDGLAEKGILRQEKGRVLGLFPTTRWPATDSRHEGEVRVGLQNALVHGTTPDPRSASLAALLSALNAAHKVIQSEGPESPDKRAVKRRAKEIREGQWAADAVGAAIQAVQTAISAAVMTSVIVSSADSSGGSS